MLDPTVRRVLDGANLAHLATLLPDGSPHSIPLWIGTHGDHVAFFTGPTSRKFRNLERDPRVALSVVPDNPAEQVILRGRVVERVDGDAGWAIVDAITEKYMGGPYPREQARVAHLIEPDFQKVGIG